MWYPPGMNLTIMRAARIVLLLALGSWVGALAGFAFFYAPRTFAVMGPTPQFAALIAGIIENLTDFGYACAVVAAVALLVLMRARVRLALATLLVVIVMTVLGWVEMSAVVAPMRVTAVRTPAFAGLHRRSSIVYGSVLVLGVVALALAALQRD